ncbi:hypothetical protein PTKIN_Ptkin19aG0133000 [Pterospermum kingtungense]
MVLSCVRRLWIQHLKKKSQKSTNQADDRPSSEYDETGILTLSPLRRKAKPWTSLSIYGFAPFIDYEIIEKATDEFNDDNFLRETIFRPVYKALLENGFEAAVKKCNCRTECLQREFENEVTLLTRFHHPNVISFLGYSYHDETAFVVCEYMPNGTLENQLHGASRGSELTWNMRLKIALDIASGLEYLHERCVPPVFHRDLKSANILLDSKFNAKISDFRLASFVGKQGKKKNDVNFFGVVGYVDPEYLFYGRYSDMTDVYAFGVILLELLLGRKPLEMSHTSGYEPLVRWAKVVLTDGLVIRNIVDPAIRGTMNVNHLRQVAGVAYMCVQEEPTHRPLITDVVQSLLPLVPEELGGTLTPFPF